MNRGGYAGKVLRINLSTRKISTEDYPEKIRETYLGGRGRNTRSGNHKNAAGY